MSRPTVYVDFDGTLCMYDGQFVIDPKGPPVPGARDFLANLVEHGFAVVVHTVRDTTRVWAWLRQHEMATFVLSVSNTKGPAVAYIDDRAVLFEGDWNQTLQEVLAFRTWWQKLQDEVEGLPDDAEQPKSPPPSVPRIQAFGSSK